MQNNEDFWRTMINSLDIDDGPTEQEQRELELHLKDAAVMRLRFDVYLITPIDDDSNKAYMVNSSNKMEDLGVMTIKEALDMIKKRNKKNP
jgi:hypothetical protein